MSVIKDKTGEVYGRLKVVEFKGIKNRHAMWLCQCECGNLVIVSSGNLVSGNTRTCGCAKESNIGELNKTHGKTNTRLYRIWRGIKSRTKYKSTGISKCYRDRNIELCQEWETSFTSFYEWAVNNGYSEELTIDRINNDLGYSPENCRWVTNKEQQNNKRNNLRVNLNGENKTISEWAELYGISRNKVYARLRRNWNVYEALTKK